MDDDLGIDRIVDAEHREWMFPQLETALPPGVKIQMPSTSAFLRRGLTRGSIAACVMKVGEYQNERNRSVGTDTEIDVTDPAKRGEIWLG